MSGGRRGPAPQVDPTRRRLVAAAPFALGGLALAAIVPSRVTGTAAASTAPARQRGPARVDIRKFGAKGDGAQDDTDALQRAIAALPDEGGTVSVPAGTYLIDPTRRVALRDRMHLELAPDAQLKAKPNAEGRAFVLMASRVSDVEISGGRILGERDAHLGTTGEWGHGIAIYGASRITVRDIHVSRCWGDGIAIGGKKANPSDRTATIPSEDVVIDNVTCTGNRRQGLTIGYSRDVTVRNSEFSDTAGTKPECGIDLEPDLPGTVVGAHIENCRVRGNRGSGIQIHKGCSEVTIRGCTIEDNGGYGVLAVGTAGGEIADNVIRGNALQGIGMRGGARDYATGRNSLSGNRLRLGNKNKSNGDERP